MPDTIEIQCPVCGRRQTVTRRTWEWTQTPTEEFPGVVQKPHPYTCGGPDCPSHTEMVPVEEDR